MKNYPADILLPEFSEFVMESNEYSDIHYQVLIMICLHGERFAASIRN